MGQENYIQNPYRLGILGEHSAGAVNVDSYVCDQDLQIGAVVAYGATEQECAPVDGATTAAQVAGVVVLDTHSDHYNSPEVVIAQTTVPVARMGVWTVRFETAINKGDPVFFRTTAPGTETLGALRADADGGNAVALPGCVAGSTTSGPGELGYLRMNLPA